MIKIIKEGKIEPKYKNIYKITCKHCGCIFECELEDFTERAKTIEFNAKIICPYCKKELHFNGTNDIEIRKEEIKENPPFYPLEPSLPYTFTPWTQSEPKRCEDCEFYKNLQHGRVYIGDSPCEWCSNYPWKVTCNSIGTDITKK